MQEHPIMELSRCLDVGCGHNYRGSVNVDLFLRETEHRDSGTGDYGLVKHKIPNLVNADAHFLPFVDNSFDTVYSSDLLEHVDRPFLALSEICRVTCRKVVVVVPHFWERKMKAHKSYFRGRWFIEAFRRIGFYIASNRITEWRCLPLKVVCIFRLPARMEIVALKPSQT